MIFILIRSYSGENAIGLFENKNNIDLVHMDIDLGKGMDGTQAAEIILKRKKIPLVFLTNHTEPEIGEFKMVWIGRIGANMIEAVASQEVLADYLELRQP